MLERKFQADLIAELRELFPDCIILKNDANYIQGFPDLLILFGDKWAALEVKNSMYARLQPNQQYYLDKLDKMGYAALTYPENKDVVILELKHYFMG